MENKDKVIVPAGLENEIAEFIDSVDATEKVVNERRRGRVVAFGISAVAVAASLLLLITLAVPRQGEPKDTFTDPYQAYACAEEALLSISQKMNSVLESVHNARKKIDAGTSKIIELYVNE